MIPTAGSMSTAASGGGRLHRSGLRGGGCSAPKSSGTSPDGRPRRGRAGVGGGWRLLVVVVVISQDTVVQRLVEQIIVDFSGPGQGSTARRTMWRGSGVPFSDATVFRTSNLDIIFTSPLLRHFAQVSCASLWRRLEEFLEDFDRWTRILTSLLCSH